MDMREIKTKNNVNAEFDIPGSKSYANRALVIAALAKGKTTLTNVPSCDDVQHMIAVVKKMGVQIEKIDETTYSFIAPEKLRYDGDVYVGLAGTATRFLTSLCTLGVGKIKIVGEKRLYERPMEDLIEALETNVDGIIQAENKTEKGERCPPLNIDSKGLKGGEIKLKGDTSSQYLTSILLSAPYAYKETTIEIIGELTSKSYADMTLDVMKDFGVNVVNNDYKNFVVPKKEYVGREYMVEIDATGANYFLAAAAIAKGKVKINNVNPNSAQGDMKFIDILEQMGCTITKGKDYFIVENHGPLKGINVDMNTLPDSAQTLAVLASVAEGSTKITGIHNLRVKETDRILAIQTELAKCGIKVETGEDYMIIHGGKPNGAQIKTYDDHRMAMSFAVLGLVVDGIIIEDPGCVSKSFPEFWDYFEKL